MSQKIRPHVRWMLRRDMPEVLQAERESFEFSWTEEDFLRRMRQRNCIGHVAEQNDRVLGYMIYELHKTRLHLLNLAVAPAARRRGVGRALVEKLAGKLAGHRRTQITLVVRESNLAAQVFFRETGFLATKVLRGYYEDSREDGYLMAFAIPATECEGATIRIRQYEEERY